MIVLRVDFTLILLLLLLVILGVIKLYAQIDMFKQIKKKHGRNLLNLVRKYERLLAKFMKLQADITFIKTC